MVFLIISYNNNHKSILNFSNHFYNFLFIIQHPNYKLIIKLMSEVLNRSDINFYHPKKIKVSLGNDRVRYNSYVDELRKKVYMNSMRNSEQVPEWMGRTNSFHSRDRNKKDMFQYSSASFQPIVRKNIYENQPQVHNTAGQFEVIPKKRMRNKWQMKNNTFELQWPRRQFQNVQQSQVSSKMSHSSRRSTPHRSARNYNFSSQNHKAMTTSLFGSEHTTGFFRDTNARQNYFKYNLPKYGIKQSPMHTQRATPIKIGHSTLIDSYVVK